MKRLQKSLITGYYRLNSLAGTLLRKQFPPFRSSGGRIKPAYGLWVNVADHCNLTCQDCNHASPAVPEYFIDPHDLWRDLSFLSKFYKPGVLTLVGGEPLLHPDLTEVLRAVRSSGICNYIVMTTNGTLLNRMSSDSWNLLNEVEISCYPESPFPPEELESLSKKAMQHGTSLSANYFDHFRTPFSLRGTRDENLRRRIFRTCKAVNVFGCHIYREGFFYKCPQAIFAPLMTGSHASHDPREDGIRLGDPDRFLSRLWDYLASSIPLTSCGYCLGTVGRSRPHQFVDAVRWKVSHDLSAEELIDFEKLEAAERGVDLDIKKELLFLRRP